jgi:hypothetical protein
MLILVFESSSCRCLEMEQNFGDKKRFPTLKKETHEAIIRLEWANTS